MFFSVFSEYELRAEPKKLEELFNAETELLYTLLGTNRAKLKAMSEDEHRKAISEFLDITGYDEILGEKQIANFTKKTLKKISELVRILPDNPDIMFEKFFLVPDMQKTLAHFDKDFIEEHLSRIEYLAEHLSLKHFGYVRKPKNTSH